MHFFYIDESGDTGEDLDSEDQPIMVLGGLSVSDKAWNTTSQEMEKLITNFFDGNPPQEIELHANQLLGKVGKGHFEGQPEQKRCALALDLLDLLASRKHSRHLIAIDKTKVKETDCGLSLAFNPSRPYLLGFDYLITLIEDHTKKKLGQSARSLIIIDEKRNHYEDKIADIVANRRYEVPKKYRIKWIVEIAYAVDSKKNRMIQLSDLIVFITRRFFEIQNGYRNKWPDEARVFYFDAYSKIHDRLLRKKLISRDQKKFERLDDYLSEVESTLPARWKSKGPLGE